MHQRSQLATARRPQPLLSIGLAVFLSLSCASCAFVEEAVKLLKRVSTKAHKTAALTSHSLSAAQKAHYDKLARLIQKSYWTSFDSIVSTTSIGKQFSREQRLNLWHTDAIFRAKVFGEIQQTYPKYLETLTNKLLSYDRILALPHAPVNSHAALESSNGLVEIATNLALKFVSKDPQAQKATIEMSESLGEALGTDYFAVKTGFISCIILLGVFIASPLIYKALSRRRLGIFISFNRTREDISENLQEYFENEGTRVFRIPFQEGATHQSIVIQATEGIKKCDSFVCLPGYTQSYVEHEVLAATTSEKPIVFLISENSGTLPNTADKRYPMFRLETTIRERSRPLIDFLSYVGADLKSTWKLCKQALRHPLIHVSGSVALSLVGISLVSLWVYCFFSVLTRGHNLSEGIPDEVKTSVMFAHGAVLIFVMSIALVCFSYVSLFLVNLVRQCQARRRARLKTVAAQFNRDDWIGVMPDLSPGGSIYECLFETAPSAHHEIEGKQNAASITVSATFGHSASPDTITY